MSRSIFIFLPLVIISLSSVQANASPQKAKPQSTSSSSRSSSSSRPSSSSISSSPSGSATNTSGPSYQERLKADKEALYQQGKNLSDQKNYQAALAVFEDANRKYPSDASILNMLAFCQRKSGRTDEAITNYHKALALQPHFPEAREYLGEAYIQAALKEIETLKSYGPDATEELGDVTKEFKEAAEAL